MQTNIIQFIIYSVISILAIDILPTRLKRHGLFALSMLFYLLCDLKFTLLIVMGICCSYVIGNILNRIKDKRILILGILPIVGILALFKYYNFFVPQDSMVLKLTMPLGLSYYSFKMISFIVDSYKGKIKDSVQWIDYANYVAFFPQIICGPISRFRDIRKQLEYMNRPTSDMIQRGIYHIVSGMFKKVVIADRVASYVDIIFWNYTTYPAIALWIAAFLFTIQIYCDFAGYSEIATGICNLLGIESVINFKYPYFSHSIKEFWSRWHISLSSWLRDYIYIPLGGNRKGKVRKGINLIVTFLVSGLWHGNTLSFVFWGMYHGIFNLITSSVKKNDNKIKCLIQITINFIIVMFGWIFFKMPTIKNAFSYIAYMFGKLEISYNSIVASVMPFTGDYSCVAHLLTISLLIIILFLFEYREWNNFGAKQERQIKMSIYVVAIVFFGAFGQNSFLYANF